MTGFSDQLLPVMQNDQTRRRKNLYGSTSVPETERWGQPREVANDFCIVGTIQMVEAVAGHVDRALLKHDLPGQRDLENAIIELVADQCIAFPQP